MPVARRVNKQWDGYWRHETKFDLAARVGGLVITWKCEGNHILAIIIYCKMPGVYHLLIPGFWHRERAMSVPGFSASKSAAGVWPLEGSQGRIWIRKYNIWSWRRRLAASSNDIHSAIKYHHHGIRIKSSKYHSRSKEPPLMFISTRIVQWYVNNGDGSWILGNLG